MSGIATAHSVVEPSPLTKRVAGTLVIVYAVITMVPLAWIVLAFEYAHAQATARKHGGTSQPSEARADDRAIR